MIAPPSPTQRVELAYDRIAEADRPEIWIQLRPRIEAIADAQHVEHRLAAGEHLPLAGTTLAVKDNIDVAGLQTTAGCPAFGYQPAADAAAVTKFKSAGAVVLGKTNLDQFATGLVGTRSPYGAVRDVRDPARIAGGSSSGSAVSVALGIADFALGTDTAGSGRVPAAFQGIVGIKPTRGLVSTRGVVPACRSFDCVSVFASTAADATAALATIAAPDREDPISRRWPSDTPLAASPRPRVAVARESELGALSAEAKRALATTIGKLGASGAEVVEVDVEPLLAAGALLYDGAFVAERFAAVGSFIAQHPHDVDPAVAEIILAGGSITAAQYVADSERLARYRLVAEATLEDCDALLLPTTPFQPTIENVALDPIETNRHLGLYTTFCNVLDMCAIALPAGEADGGHFGITLFGPAFHDSVLADLAARLSGLDTSSAAPLAPGIELLVVGAHMSGHPLNHELLGCGGRLLRRACTAPYYRLYRLATTPPKPGLVRVERSGAGAAIEGEVWALPPAGLARLQHLLSRPMTLGRVSLESDEEIIGFLCEPAALADAEDITMYGGWRPYLRRRTDAHSSGATP